MAILCEAYVLQEITTILDTQTSSKIQQWLSVLVSLPLERLAELQEKAESFAALRSKVLCQQVLRSQQNLTSDPSKLNRPDFVQR